MAIVVVIVKLIKVSRKSVWFENIDVAVELGEENNRCVGMFHKCSETVAMRYMFVRKSKKASMRSTKLDM